ncbi:hypothetical protein SHI21_19620 [Bacteriovorax sp. PP10]|uniref:EF-hand domain-containing protein n=1 Tax=Bacteriovorax antarcticus TaxID=3088717 RepID=A0ABU5W3S3_9BACT|nr:hypothetical protein [Bacteriovorax sp. PP10]MEA9358455.1 hypothetical protein [Bacteriovorax sp. PP10]
MKKLKVILAGASILFFGSCAFKNEDSASTTTQTSTTVELKIDPNGDSDGDGVIDQEELNVGRNPFLADLPDLKVRFLQNYKIEISYHKIGSDKVVSFVVDTKVNDTDPDYKFRVGKVFARSHALRAAASFGRFSSHSSGKIEEKDYSWVSYPELDPKFFNQKALEFRTILDSGIEVDNIKITLSNQARLMESPLFKEIKDLKLNFYYLNHNTENYEILSSTLVERHFQGGVYETFDVVIENAPLSLLKDSFFKRGEFIISEVDDYVIPDKGTSYKTLLASVRAKSLPVLLETPLEEKLYYVASTSEGISFQNILKTVFDRNYKIENDQLLKIGQFENNLGTFTHLREVQDKDKLGNWFVMTNELKKNYLDHSFINQDRIVLAYITGSDLSEQQQESIYSYREKVDSNKNESIIPIGNVTPNSRIDIQLKPLSRFGREITKVTENFSRPGGSCGNNCIQLAMNCSWLVNTFKDYNEPFNFSPDLTGEGEKLDLVVNGEAFSVKDLLKEKKISIYKTEIGTHLTIQDINKIKELNDFDENSLSLRVRAFVGNDFFGVKLVDMGGFWRGVGGCPFNTPAVAEKYKTQISKETREIGEISWLINDLANRGYAYKFSLIDSGAYYQEISFGVSSVIQNFYN